MLRFLISLSGRRLACLLAMAYAIGCMMPSAAMAFGDGAASAICIDEIAEQVQVVAVHVHVHIHSDGTVHRHREKSPDAKGDTAHHEGDNGVPSHSHDANCCGLFGFSAVLPQMSGAIYRPAVEHMAPLSPANCLVGCGPDRINRPPISPLPM